MSISHHFKRIRSKFSTSKTVRKPHKTPVGQRLILLDSHGIDVVFDIGANVGQTGLELFTNGWRGRVVSFEPASAAHAELCRTAARFPRWEVAEPMAIGDRDGELDIFLARASDLSSVLVPKQDLLEALPKAAVEGTERVPVRRLDTVFNSFVAGGDERVFVKIDTQGYERRVLAGAQNVIGQIQGLQIELSFRPLYEGEPIYLEILTELEAAGFMPELILPGYFSRKLNRQLQFDILVFRTGNIA